ncbi:hypothetical protein GCK72_001776 [Caenorhabditis remanei]|uniref:Uncharacterized protein n=2 Tax=Caenorhabditis remanei TaxID=31234 RepID=A0A6A5HQI9_CAERE|nr:hypothetical protein GCK72_001776 [Caenorhabditis remanei]KAF1769959.1 hypothetical protein GCK72_001776 [Caenorhabditis remanei]
MDTMSEEFNPFCRGTIAFYFFCFILGIMLSRCAHRFCRTSRFHRFRRYPVEKKLSSLTQINHPDFTFIIGPEDIRYSEEFDLDWCKTFLRENFPNHSAEIPQNLCSLWVPREGFTCGTTFQEFSPKEGKLKDSFLTYQMITERAQVTWYNLKDGRHFVAGICIYLRLEMESNFIGTPPIDEEAVEIAMEMGYDYVPPKPKKEKKKAKKHGATIYQAALDAGLIMPKENKEKTRYGFTDEKNPNPPDYTALLMENQN